MHNPFGQWKQMALFFSNIFPDLKLEKKELNKENAETVIRCLVFLLDALLKAENAALKKNFAWGPNKKIFARDTVSLMENIILFLQVFNTQALTLTKNERQTFIFILENIIEYFRQQQLPEEEKGKKNLFVDFQFWIENLFKMFDLKISGSVIPSEQPDLKGFLPSGHPAYPDLIYTNPMVTFSLFPFLISQNGHSLFLVEASERGVTYLDVHVGGELLLVRGDIYRKVSEFYLANFALNELETAKGWMKEVDESWLRRAVVIESAISHHNQKLFADSFNLLNEAGADGFNMPLVYLLQIRNMIELNRSSEAKRLLQKFLLFYPYFAEGHEWMGDIYFREENYELALGFYEKAAQIRQNKILTEKTKKVKENIEKHRGKSENQKNDLFFSITEMVLQNEETIISRQKELRQMIEILISNSKRNVLLIGDRGVGKSTLIRLLAQNIILDAAPEPLREKKIVEINYVSLLTGSKYRGQFEEKVLKFFQEFRSQNSILVLEDIHLMVASGVARGTSLDLVNILKIFLRDNSIQVIATTDYEEYKNTLEKDNSLLGHFQKIVMNEMSVDETGKVIKNLADALNGRERIAVSDGLIDAIVESAKRNIRERRLPDSAIMLLERCVARLKYKNNASGAGQREVTDADLSEVLADILNVPETNVPISLKSRLLGFKENILKRIVGQDQAIDGVTAGIVASKLGYDIKKNRPNGVFLFIGPTGVGKTETAIAISEALYGNSDSLIRIDMSEYMERFTYSRFVGAAPGYVGYYDANQLTDKVRQNPYSVILLDEIEKADSQLLNIFLQVFDAGRLTDARGNVVDFSNTTIIMTSNIGTSLFSKANMGYQGNLNGTDVSHSTLIKSLKRFFSPEFLNRIDEIVVFKHLDPAAVRGIIQVQLRQLRKDLGKLGKELVVTEEAVDLIARKGYSLEYGARNLSRTLKKELLEKLAPLSLEKIWDDARYVICAAADDVLDISIEPSGAIVPDDRFLLEDMGSSSV